MLVKNFEDAEQATQDSRAEAEQARDYFDGKQWSDDEIAELAKRKQPVITDNKLKDKIEYLIGLEAASRTDPKAYPRTPMDEESAEAATDALRFVAENNDLDSVVSDIAENMLIEGAGGCEVTVRRKGDDVEIVIPVIPWDRMYFDPHSMKRDFSDARYLGQFVWMDQEEAASKWPDVDWDSVATEIARTAGDTFDDKPKTRWFDSNRKRVRVVEQYFRKDGKWCVCKFVNGEFLEEPRESAYQMEGESDHPYAWMSAYVDRDGNRYGVVRRYKTLQDEINHRRSKALHILNNRQIFAETGAFDNKVKARREVNKPDGFVEYNKGFDAEIRDNTELAAGQAQLLADAIQALSTTGPTAMDGASSASGRAKLIDQQTDVLELGRLFDQLRALKRQIYRKIWARVQQFWTDEKWIRIRDEEGRAKFAQLNQPVTAEMAAQENPDLAALAQYNPNQIVDIRNNVADLDVDIILDEAPDAVNIQIEQFEALVNLSGAGVVFPPDVYIEASSLRNKDQLLEKLRGGDDPAVQQQMQQEQMIAMQERMSKIEKDMAAARKSNAEADQTELENKVGLAAAAGMANG